jgi:hypothetical protein
MDALLIHENVYYNVVRMIVEMESLGLVSLKPEMINIMRQVQVVKLK